MAGRALEALLQGVGYDTRLIEDPLADRPEDVLGGVRLLLVAPTLSRESEAFLAEMRSAPHPIPVLTLTTALKDVFADHPDLIPWPCRLEDLAKRIEAALLPAPAVGES